MVGPSGNSFKWESSFFNEKQMKKTITFIIKNVKTYWPLTRRCGWLATETTQATNTRLVPISQGLATKRLWCPRVSRAFKDHHLTRPESLRDRLRVTAVRQRRGNADQDQYLVLLDQRPGRKKYCGNLDSGFVNRKPNGGLMSFSVHALRSLRLASIRFLIDTLLSPPTRILTITSGT
jgi:hypothetical protein